MTRGLGRNAFDLPVAALAGLAAAIVAFAMPADLLGQLVSATGLPQLLAAAEPPLGLKARGAIGIAAAAASFGFVFMMMRMLDRAGRTKHMPEPEIDEDAPRLRRRDLHPDAPICRPISATRDFGEPAPPPLRHPDPEAQIWCEEPESPSEALEAPAAPDAREAPDADQQAAPSWSASLEEPLELADHHVPAWLPDAAPQAEAEKDEPKPEPVTEASLADLMRRLEHGLKRRRTPQVFSPTRQQAPGPQVFPEAHDDRLQSAIDSLQRFAARAE